MAASDHEERAGESLPGAGGDEASPGPGTSRQTSLARIQEFGVVPKRSLGQNFLVDDNILRLILARLEPGPEDVVLEVGAGLGVLTEALARAAGRVHAFEVDPTLEAPLRATLGSGRPVTLHFADILRAELEALAPPPTLCASNLPYSVAAPFMAEAVGRLPGIRRYVVMTQREVADRLAAPPGSRTYGGVSAWVQLHLELVEHRPLSRSIFYPRPNVDSSLLTFRRREVGGLLEDRPAAVKGVIDAAFAQRRKTLVNTLSGGLALTKDEAREALARAGLPPRIRAEAVAPDGFVELTAAILEMAPGAI